MREGFIQTELGRVHYVRAGSGHPLILLHSNGNSVHEWEDVLDDLASTFDVIALDQPGQGDSGGLTRHTTIDEYCDSFIEIMDALDVEQAAVAGTSIGGIFVVSLGARYPDQILHTRYPSHPHQARILSCIFRFCAAAHSSVKAVFYRVVSPHWQDCGTSG